MRNSYEMLGFIFILTSCSLLFIIQLKHKLLLDMTSLLSNLTRVDKIIAIVALVSFIVGFIFLLLSF